MRTSDQTNLTALVHSPNTSSGEPYTTSEIMAGGTGITHKKLKVTIRKYEDGLASFGKVGRYQTTLESGQQAVGYILNEQQATFLLTLLKNTPAVVSFKQELVRQFYAMREQIRERSSPVWQDARALGKEIRRVETDAIKELVAYAQAQGSRNAGHYYAHLTRLADSTVGINERDKADTIQLVALLGVERIIAQEIRAGIEAGINYRLIYQTVKTRLTSAGTALNVGR